MKEAFESTTGRWNANHNIVLVKENIVPSNTSEELSLVINIALLLITVSLRA